MTSSTGLTLAGIVKGSFTMPLSPELERILEGVISDSRILALGECFHTSDGFYNAKIRILQHLIQKQSLRAIAFENSWADSKVINAYVGGEAVSLEEAAANLFHIWRSKSVVSFLRWLRDFNSDLPLGQKVFFFGIDIQKPGRCLSIVRKFCHQHLGPELGVFDSLKGSLILRECEKDNFYDVLSIKNVFNEHGRNKVQEDLDALLEGIKKAEQTRLETSSEDLELQIGLKCLAFYFQYIFELSDGDSLPSEGSQTPPWKKPFETRDNGMFEVFQLIYRSIGEPKIVLWAHNLHIVIAGETAPVWGVKSFGSLFFDSYGDSYYPIALTAGHFEINWPWLPQMKDFVPEPPEPGTMEHTLKSEIGSCYVDLEDSGIFPPQTGLYQFHPVENLKKHFRAVIYLDSSSAMEIFEPSL